ncbi:DUF333 domain-containing protein [Snodgrassella sp. CFCC 13594]|uniref:putative hemolysin n=1 Tax=Snodgrassella sp. CFCC 13594 TaxID=1775559 RepID=UPI0008353A3E|nr:DUF333 domain-containing protein [Snodgrassella sp. CFCC 13594]
MKKTSWLLLAVPVMTLAACSSDKQPLLNMANPAAKFCVAQGGSLAPQTDAKGNQSAMCHLPDGRVVEEWAYFREQNSAKPAQK